MLLDLFLIGLAISLEPIPLTAFILVLSAERGVVKGAAYLLGWLACLVAVIALTLLATGDKPPAPASAPSTALVAGKLAIGVGLVAFGLARRRREPRPRKPPSWTRWLDRLSLPGAAALAALLQPWVLVAAGAATIAEAKVSSAGEYLALFGFCLWATASLLAMEFYAVFAPEAAQARLGALRHWLDTHRDQAVALVSIAIGLWLTGKSCYQLAT